MVHNKISNKTINKMMYGDNIQKCYVLNGSKHAFGDSVSVNTLCPIRPTLLSYVTAYIFSNKKRRTEGFYEFGSDLLKN